jgi:hypothetical protein
VSRKDSRVWQPMARTARHLSPQTLRMAREDPDFAKVMAGAREMWGNNVYSATVRRRGDGSVESISVHRRDRRPLRDWRDMYHIKTDIAGPDVEAVELYPAADRLMDTSNEYWLWCFPPGVRLPIGFEHERNVGTHAEAAEFGATQREPDYEGTRG